MQAAANAALSRSIHGNIPFAAGTLFLVAGLATALVALAQGGTLPGWTDLRGAPWWSYTGGLIVAFYVFTITFLAPRLGVGTAIALIVTGQVLGALIIDHFGLLRSLDGAAQPGPARRGDADRDWGLFGVAPMKSGLRGPPPPRAIR